MNLKRFVNDGEFGELVGVVTIVPVAEIVLDAFEEIKELTCDAPPELKK